MLTDKYKFLRVVEENKSQNLRDEDSNEYSKISILLEGPNFNIRKIPLSIDKEDLIDLTESLNSNEDLKEAILDEVIRSDVYTLVFKPKSDEHSELHIHLPKILSKESFNVDKHHDLLKSDEEDKVEDTVSNIFKSYTLSYYWLISLGGLLIGTFLCIILIFILSNIF